MIDFHAHLGKVVTATALTVEKLLRFMDQHGIAQSGDPAAGGA